VRGNSSAVLMQNNDTEVIEKIKSGDNSEFEKLITRYSRMIFSLSYRLLRNVEEANDLTQEVFFRAYRFIDKYNPEFKFSTWLVRITYNLYKDRFKTKQVQIIQLTHADDDDRPEEQIADKSAGPDERVEKSLKSKEIVSIINMLPGNYKSVIVLYFWGDYSYEEIAEILEIPVGTVKSRLKRAKGFLLEKYVRLLEKWK